MGGLKEINHVWHSAECLAHHKNLITVNLCCGHYWCYGRAWVLLGRVCVRHKERAEGKPHGKLICKGDFRKNQLFSTCDHFPLCSLCTCFQSSPFHSHSLWHTFFKSHHIWYDFSSSKTYNNHLEFGKRIGKESSVSPKNCWKCAADTQNSETQNLTHLFLKETQDSCPNKITWIYCSCC